MKRVSFASGRMRRARDEINSMVLRSLIVGEVSIVDKLLHHALEILVVVEFLVQERVMVLK